MSRVSLYLLFVKLEKKKMFTLQCIYVHYKCTGRNNGEQYGVLTFIVYFQ